MYYQLSIIDAYVQFGRVGRQRVGTANRATPMIAAAFLQPSLVEVHSGSAITAAVNWVVALLFGPLATGIAVLAVAGVGIAMLSGHLDVRRALSVLFGCFLLFGARAIANGLQSSAATEGLPPISAAPPMPEYETMPPSTNNANAFDPYAGDTAMRAEQ